MLVLLSQPGILKAQNQEQKQVQGEKERAWTLNGYVKDMASYALTNNPLLPGQQTSFDNLVHNRLNFKWYGGEHFKFAAEMRNRLFTGDRVRKNPYFSELTFARADDYWTLSHFWEDSADVVLHVMLDRLYMHYMTGAFEVRAGRQRINWGINMAWNPNDIFNAFSYFDFDYEERPGSDALLLRYNTGTASSIELAGKMADSIADFTGGALWKINYRNYDIQFLGGISHENAVVGMGWAGNIQKSGFKGEASWFYPLEEARDQSEVLAASISLERSFKSSLMLNASALYSSNGKKSPDALEQALYYSGNISAKYLSPYLYSGLLQAGYQFHPLVNGGLVTIFYPGSTDLFLNPYFTVSIFTNFDLYFIAQVLFNETADAYTATNQLYYLRLKYSF